MRDLVMVQIKYWEERQSAHCTSFYERRIPPTVPKKDRHNWKSWSQSYWDSLPDAEFISQFSYFMMKQGRTM